MFRFKVALLSIWVLFLYFIVKSDDLVSNNRFPWLLQSYSDLF